MRKMTNIFSRSLRYHAVWYLKDHHQTNVLCAYWHLCQDYRCRMNTSFLFGFFNYAAVPYSFLSDISILIKWERWTARSAHIQMLLPFISIRVDWNDNSQLWGDPLQERQDMQAKNTACMYRIWTSILLANTLFAVLQRGTGLFPCDHICYIRKRTWSQWCIRLSSCFKC